MPATIKKITEDINSFIRSESYRYYEPTSVNALIKLIVFGIEWTKLVFVYFTEEQLEELMDMINLVEDAKEQRSICNKTLKSDNLEQFQIDYCLEYRKYINNHIRYHTKSIKDTVDYYADNNEDIEEYFANKSITINDITYIPEGMDSSEDEFIESIESTVSEQVAEASKLESENGIVIELPKEQRDVLPEEPDYAELADIYLLDHPNDDTSYEGLKGMINLHNELFDERIRAAYYHRTCQVFDPSMFVKMIFLRKRINPITEQIINDMCKNYKTTSYCYEEETDDSYSCINLPRDFESIGHRSASDISIWSDEKISKIQPIAEIQPIPELTNTPDMDPFFDDDEALFEFETLDTPKKTKPTHQPTPTPTPINIDINVFRQIIESEYIAENHNRHAIGMSHEIRYMQHINPDMDIIDIVSIIADNSDSFYNAMQQIFDAIDKTKEQSKMN